MRTVGYHCLAAALLAVQAAAQTLTCDTAPVWVSGAETAHLQQTCATVARMQELL
ncbi:hypothetical protein C8N43_1986 [Litoreibacter ponti]|uniref:Uncharacterized protein n=1 Tax=Litoreibacter ponti TaxID=1510457 RepID=A0A2T6BMN0_9RHOB|nr:hypothetical protein [Litoreibacter ponti]PTX57319.1 hypothetical protein C8N43_1986 [Litoreibacter ponti]